MTLGIVIPLSPRVNHTKLRISFLFHSSGCDQSQERGAGAPIFFTAEEAFGPPGP
jgi:hypothetical protein